MPQAKRAFSSGIAVLCIAGFAAGLHSAPPARADWAVAAGSNGAVTDVFDADDSAAAVSAALGSCNQKSAGCKIIAQGSNGCFALAGTDNNGWGWAHRTSLGGAISGAMVNCVAANPLGCRNTQIQFCDRTHGFEEGQTTEADREAYQHAIDQAGANRAQHDAEENSQTTEQILQGILGGAGGLNSQPAYSPNGCRRPADYKACIWQGANGRGGGGPNFCFQQFC